MSETRALPALIADIASSTKTGVLVMTRTTGVPSDASESGPAAESARIADTLRAAGYGVVEQVGVVNEQDKGSARSKRHDVVSGPSQHVGRLHVSPHAVDEVLALDAQRLLEANVGDDHVAVVVGEAELAVDRQVPGAGGTVRDRAGQLGQMAKDNPLATGAIAAVLLGACLALPAWAADAPKVKFATSAGDIVVIDPVQSHRLIINGGAT